MGLFWSPSQPPCHCTRDLELEDSWVADLYYSLGYVSRLQVWACSAQTCIKNEAFSFASVPVDFPHPYQHFHCSSLLGIQKNPSYLEFFNCRAQCGEMCQFWLLFWEMTSASLLAISICKLMKTQAFYFVLHSSSTYLKQIKGIWTVVL